MRYLIGFMLCAGLAQADAPFTCTSAHNPRAPLLRSEGLTELVGDLLLECSGGPASTIGQPLPTIDLSVGLNGIHSQLRLGPPGFVDAVVLVDDPAPSEQRFAPVFPGSLISFTGQAISDGKPLNFHAGNVPNAYQAFILNANSIGFSGIPVDGLQHNFRIANVRAKAAR